MTVYLDASVLVSLLVDDVHTAAARRLNDRRPMITISRWTIVECSSAFARLVRVGNVTEAERDELEEMLSVWSGRTARLVPVLSEDFETSRGLVRKSRVGLRASDALHLAVTARVGLELATLDETLKRAAGEFGVPTTDLR